MSFLNGTLVQAYVANLKMSYTALPSNTRLLFVGFYSASSIITTLLNIVTILLLPRCKVLPEYTTMQLASLCITDLIYGVLIGPLSILKLYPHYIRQINFKMVDTAIDWIFPCIDLVTEYVLAFVAYDRYKRVTHPRIQTDTFTITAILGLCWFIPVVSTCMQIVGIGEVVTLSGNVEYILIIFVIVYYYVNIKKTILVHPNSYGDDDENMSSQVYFASAMLWVISLYLLVHLFVLVNRILIKAKYSLNTEWIVSINCVFLTRSALNPFIYCWKNPIFLNYVRTSFRLKALPVNEG